MNMDHIHGICPLYRDDYLFVMPNHFGKSLLPYLFLLHQLGSFLHNWYRVVQYSSNHLNYSLSRATSFPRTCNPGSSLSWKSNILVCHLCLILLLPFLWNNQCTHPRFPYFYELPPLSMAMVVIFHFQVENWALKVSTNPSINLYSYLEEF